MHNIDSPHSQNEAEQTSSDQLWWSAEAFQQARQHKLEEISKIANPEIKELAQKELWELETAEKQMNRDKLSIQNARHEFRADMGALSLLDSKFSKLAGFGAFANFFSSQELSENELENLYDFLNQQWWSALREFRKNGFPISREDFQVFAEKFGIPTSATIQEKESLNINSAKEIYLRAIPTLRNIPWNPNVAELVSMLDELQSFEWTDAQIQMQQISIYLVGEDGKSGHLDAILTSLRKQDAQNAKLGKPTRHFEIFTRSIRDFGPQVSLRVDQFIETTKASNPHISQAQKHIKQAEIDASFPKGVDIQERKDGTIIGKLPDGTRYTLKQKGSSITQYMTLPWANLAIPLERSSPELEQARTQFEADVTKLSGRLETLSSAQSFLKETISREMSVEEVKPVLRQILGYSTCIALGIEATSATEQIERILTEASTETTRQIEKAENTFQLASQSFISQERERNAETDERVKTTLRAISHSGLGLCDPEFLIPQITSRMTIPDIGVPFEATNINLAYQNFWEPVGLTNNPTKHIEYIYRFANKIITGNPKGIVDGKLVGFSLDQAIRNPDVPQKTDGEVKALLLASGVWNETTGVDKARVLAELARPLWTSGI